MARRGRHRRGGRVTPKGTRPLHAGRGRGHARHDDDERPPEADDELGELDLIAGVRRSMAADHPLALLAEVSTLLAVVDPRGHNPFLREPGPDQMSKEELVRSLLEVERRETSALLAVLAALDDDELQRARLQRELRRRAHALPEWIGQLDRTEVYRAVEQVHVLGDGDNLFFGARVGGAHELSVVVYVDHNLGTIVKDAFVVPGPVDDLLAFMHEKSDDPDTTWNDLSLADAGARASQAIDDGARHWPPHETDSWPACRPLVEWTLRHAPSGGEGYVRAEWTDPQLAAIQARFFASPFAAGFDHPDHHDLLGSILWFGSGYGPGDPLRWSAVAVEILLADWIPRKIVADADHLAKAPELLRAFIRFCHDDRGIRAGLTTETLEAVDRCEPEYQEVIRAPRLQGPAALLAAAGVLDPDTLDLDDMPGYDEIMLDGPRRAVGGDDALGRLDDAPLPDEPFRWEGIADDVHDMVGSIVSLCDGFAASIAEPEFRTACRRLLAQVARGDATVFQRRARPETAAAALCWIVAKANESFRWSDLTAKAMAIHFGIAPSSSSQRAKTLLRAGGFQTDHYDGMYLGSPDYLVSSHRRRLLDLRERYGGLDS